MSILAFNRIEKKFILNKSQYYQLKNILYNKMELDSHCPGAKPYKICNIYYDTKNNDLISNSISKPLYKEKLRLRKYYNGDVYFLEIKRKSHGIVGKRRIALNKRELNAFFNGDELKHINDYSSRMAIKEIRYFLKRYELKPVVYISYDRLGFFDKDDKMLRVTIDSNIKSRRYCLDIDNDACSNYVIPQDMYVLEIKSVSNFPLWLIRVLKELDIKISSFSKYGKEYVGVLNDR